MHHKTLALFLLFCCLAGSFQAHAYTDSQRARLYIIYLNKAKLADRMGDEESAIVYYKKALEMRPSDELAHDLFDHSYDKTRAVYQASSDTMALQRLDEYRYDANRYQYQPVRTESQSYQPQPIRQDYSYSSKPLIPRQVNYDKPYQPEVSSTAQPISSHDPAAYWEEPDGTWVKTAVKPSSPATVKAKTDDGYMPSISVSATDEEISHAKRQKNVNLFKKAFRGIAGLFKGGQKTESSPIEHSIKSDSKSSPSDSSNPPPIIPKNRSTPPDESVIASEYSSTQTVSRNRTADNGEFNGFRWLQMSWEQKQNAARDAAEILTAAGMRLSGDASDYVLEVNKLLADQPELASDRFELIFAKAVNYFESHRPSSLPPAAKTAWQSEPEFSNFYNEDHSLSNDRRRVIHPDEPQTSASTVAMSKPVRSEGVTFSTSVVAAPDETVSKSEPKSDTPSVSHSSGVKSLMGSDWKNMSSDEKLDFIKSVSLDLHRAGVPMRNTHQQHIAIIDGMIDKYPAIQNQTLVSIFSKIVNESQSMAQQSAGPAAAVRQPDPAPGETPTFQSKNFKASAWTQMDYETKKGYVASAAKLLSESNIRLTKPHQEYVFMLDDFLKKYPESENQDLSEIFARVIYVIDPEARQALENKRNSQNK